MKKLISFFTVALVLFSCSNSGRGTDIGSKKGHISSWEVMNGDTINQTDWDGKKQGKWVRNPYSGKDSIWKHGDTLYFKDGILMKP